MENLLVIALLCLSISSLVLWIKEKMDFSGFLSYLFILTVLLVAGQYFDDATAGTKFTGFLVSLLSLHWLASLFLKAPWKQYLGLAGSLLFLFWKGSTLKYLSYPLVFDEKNALLLPLIGAAFPLILHFKAGFLGNFFKIKRELLERNLRLMGAGMLILAATYFAGPYGLVLTALGYFSTEVYLRRSWPSGSLLLFSTAFVLVVLKSSGIDVNAFVHGSTLIGLFVGLGILFWTDQVKSLNAQAWYKKLAYYLIPVVLIFALVFFEKLKEHTGGISALSAILLILAVGNETIRESAYKFHYALLTLSFALYLFAIPLFQPVDPSAIKPQNSKFEQFQDQVITEFELPDVAEPNPELIINKETNTTKPAVTGAQNKSESKDSVQNPTIKKSLFPDGQWMIVSDASSLEFELGPSDARTKGMFKSLTGTFTFQDGGAGSSVTVQLPLTGFTTYNDFRDESLMDESYLHAEKYPQISFTSSEWIEAGKQIQIKGNVTLRGIKQNIRVVLNLVDSGKDAKGDYLLLMGKSKLDRTKHGMSSDPKIGDVVDFTFKLELRKK